MSFYNDLIKFFSLRRVLVCSSSDFKNVTMSGALGFHLLTQARERGLQNESV